MAEFDTPVHDLVLKWMVLVDELGTQYWAIALVALVQE
jgi:hypothetical protein